MSNLSQGVCLADRQSQDMPPLPSQKEEVTQWQSVRYNSRSNA